MRGAMVFAALRLNLVVTPLTGSQLDVAEAIRTAQMVPAFGNCAGKPLLHRCLMTRVPAALKPRSLKAVVEQLRDHQVVLLPTALVEKEAFRRPVCPLRPRRGLEALEARGIYGLPAARQNTEAYVRCICEVVQAA